MKKFMKTLGVVAVASAAVVAPDMALAAFDTVPIVTAVGEAETAGLSVGTKVVAAVAAFVVIGVIISMVRKV